MASNTPFLSSLPRRHCYYNSLSLHLVLIIQQTPSTFTRAWTLIITMLWKTMKTEKVWKWNNNISDINIVTVIFVRLTTWRISGHSELDHYFKVTFSLTIRWFILLSFKWNFTNRKSFIFMKYFWLERKPLSAGLLATSCSQCEPR